MKQHHTAVHKHVSKTLRNPQPTGDSPADWCAQDTTTDSVVADRIYSFLGNQAMVASLFGGTDVGTIPDAGEYIPELTSIVNDIRAGEKLRFEADKPQLERTVDAKLAGEYSTAGDGAVAELVFGQFQTLWGNQVEPNQAVTELTPFVNAIRAGERIRLSK